MQKQFHTLGGQSILLGHAIGKGGEGEVFEVSGRQDSAAKIYTDGRADNRQGKIEAMVVADLSQRTDIVTFPIDVLLDQKRKFAGFTMRRVREARPVHQLWDSRDRQANFPHATVAFMVRVAANVARAVAELHHTGCVIGDINESGFLVTDQATVVLIDSDSFQFASGGRIFPCVVGTPEYLPPEQQGVSQRHLGPRDANHDNFGLAVMIFRLLMNGTHPFRGVWKGRGDPPSPPKWIEDFLYPYGSDRTNSKIAPQPAAPPVSWLPGEIRDAFDRAFGRSGVQNRPSASDWIALLQRLEKGLVKCGYSSFHYYLPGTRDCPWCAMERDRGRALFGRLSGTTQTAHTSGLNPRAGSSGRWTYGGSPMFKKNSQKAIGGSDTGMRNAVLAIIGVAIVSLWIFGREGGGSGSVSVVPSGITTAPVRATSPAQPVPQGVPTSFGSFISETEARTAIETHYNTKSEWNGIFKIQRIDRAELSRISATEVRIDAEYAYECINPTHRSCIGQNIGVDRRWFVLTKSSSGRWIGQRMGEHMSARFSASPPRKVAPPPADAPQIESEAARAAAEAFQAAIEDARAQAQAEAARAAAEAARARLAEAPERTAVTATPGAPEPRGVTATEARSAAKLYYDTQGEWKGVFSIQVIKRIKLTPVSSAEVRADVEYEFKCVDPGNHRCSGQFAGTDRRWFTLRRSPSGDWVGTRMGGHMSAHF